MFYFKHLFHPPYHFFPLSHETYPGASDFVHKLPPFRNSYDFSLDTACSRLYHDITLINIQKGGTQMTRTINIKNHTTSHTNSIRELDSRVICAPHGLFI